MIPPYDLVCVSHLRWGFVYQRPHHLLSRFARERRVFYIEEPMFDEGPPRMHVYPEKDGLSILCPHLPHGLSEEEIEGIQQRLIDDLLAGREYVLWYYTPMAVSFTRHLKPLATVYDCMDELSAFSEAPTTLRDREGELFDSADLVFTGGESLYEAKRKRHSNVYLFPSSVDVEHFSRARQPLTDPPDQAGIPHPRLGFFGVIDERIDTALLSAVAEIRPEWQFVMIGPVVKIDPAVLPRGENIHYLGERKYPELPAYLAGWDAALIPFARNQFTRFLSPTKTLEYLAAGKPVVSTSIRDVVHPYGEQGLVRIADSPDEFVAAAEAALEERPEELLPRVDSLLAQMSWDRTWKRMTRLIEGSIAANQDAAAGTDGDRPSLESSTRDRPGLATGAPKGHSRNGGGGSAFDYLVVGAGFAGSVLAERLASQSGKRVLVVERRNHIAGNAYDHYNDDGILIHRYGPHIFHTNSNEVFDYLSLFTEWRPYEHRVRASVDGQLVPIPINLDTINQLYGLSLTSFELEEFFTSVAEPMQRIRTSEDVVVSRVGRELYEKFFRGYTRKQWDLDPSELDASVTARVPTRTNRDDRYFTDKYQAMPLHGYTRMFENMLSHPNIKVLLNTDYKEVRNVIAHKELIYTGPVDEFFDFRYGKLPYRSLEFKFETVNAPVYQPAPVVNYPNDNPYTRVTEFKYLTGQEHPKTTIVYEFPRAEGDPYYPVPKPENAALYKRYKALAEATAGVHFVGRLATYKYYNMDQVAAQALSVFERMAGGERPTLEEDDAEPTTTSGPAGSVGRAGVHGEPSGRGVLRSTEA